MNFKRASQILEEAILGIQENEIEEATIGKRKKNRKKDLVDVKNIMLKVKKHIPGNPTGFIKGAIDKKRAHAEAVDTIEWLLKELQSYQEKGKRVGPKKLYNTYKSQRFLRHYRNKPISFDDFTDEVLWPLEELDVIEDTGKVIKFL